MKVESSKLHKWLSLHLYTRTRVSVRDSASRESYDMTYVWHDVHAGKYQQRNAPADMLNLGVREVFPDMLLGDCFIWGFLTLSMECGVAAGPEAAGRDKGERLLTRGVWRSDFTSFQLQRHRDTLIILCGLIGISICEYNYTRHALEIDRMDTMICCHPTNGNTIQAYK